MTQKLPPWTYSHLEMYETCPRQYYYHHILKEIPFSPSEATMWGDRVHKALEAYIKHGIPLPEGMKQWQGLMDKLSSMPGEKHTEYNFALDKNFQPTTWRNAWTRGKGDLLVINGEQAAVLDYKTGKRKLTWQLHLYACYTLATFPEVQEVQTGFVWLKDKKIDHEVVKRSDVGRFWTAAVEKHGKLLRSLESGKWPCNPNGLCKDWCPCVKCEYNGRYRGE